MTPDEYVKQAVLTESDPATAIGRLQNNPRLMRLLHAAFGLATEAGEFMDELKRDIFYGKAPDMVNLQEEIGDLFWYIAVAVSAINAELAATGSPSKCRGFADIMQQNINKLRARYPNNFTEFDALNRNTNQERGVLEQS